MSTTYSSLTAVLLLAASPLLANAQPHISYPTCDSSWSWTYNSLGQSPCVVGAYLQSVCGNGTFLIPALASNTTYLGPTGPLDANDLCKCNTVVYSLMSACAACQGNEWLSWKSWKKNCTAVDPPQTYSNIVPDGTRVQEWAFIDVIERKNGFWDPVLSFQYGDQAEISPGQAATMTSLPAPTSTATSIPGLSSSQAQYLDSKTTSSNNARIEAIVGGVFGGVVLVAAAVALFLWRARVKRRRATRDAAAVIFAKGDLAMQEKSSSGD